jgi:hypothetical protein
MMTRNTRTLRLEQLQERKLFAGLIAEDFSFQSNFEEQNVSEWQHRPNGGGWNLRGSGGFVDIGGGNSLALVDTSLAASGTKAMKITFHKDEDIGGATVPLPGRGVDVIRTTQKILFDKQFDFGQAVKIHRLTAGDDDGTKIDILVQLWGKPTAKLPNGGNDMTGINDTYEISIGSNGSKDGPAFEWPSYGADFTVERGRWYEIASEVKLNSVGKADGEARLWVDGKLLVDKSGIAMRKTDEWGINRAMFGGWYSNSGGNNPSPNPVSPSNWYIDDVTVVGGDSFTPEVQFGPRPLVTFCPVGELPNNAPQLLDPGTVRTRANEPISVQLTASDMDGDLLNYEIVGKAPEGMEINQRTGLIEWNPDAEQTNKTYVIRVRVTDDAEDAKFVEGDLRVEVEQLQEHSIGVFRDGNVVLDRGEYGYQRETAFQFGLAKDQVVAGDWDGDGFDEVGVFRDGWFFLDTGKPGYDGELPFQFGLPGDIPIAGDWDGNGVDEVGVYRKGSFFLDSGARGYNGEQPFRFGPRGSTPVAGDWNGDGVDEVGVALGGRFLLDEGPRGPSGEKWFRFGDSTSLPIAGDWDGNGKDEVGAYKPGTLYSTVKLDTGRRGNDGETEFQFGLRGDRPFSGRWRTENEIVFGDSDAVDEIIGSGIVSTDYLEWLEKMSGRKSKTRS